MDFGLAKLLSPEGQPSVGLTRSQAQVGTPRYMSPEQVMGREADARSDLYAFGAVLYELVTGQRAFPGEDAPALPQALETLILRLLEKDPLRRPAAADVIRLLERLARSLDRPAASTEMGGAALEPSASGVATPTPLGLGQLPARSAFVGRSEE